MCIQIHTHTLYIHISIHTMLIDEFEGEWGGTCERVCREKWEKKSVIIKI